MEVQYNVTGAVSDGDVWVVRRIIEEPNGCIAGCLRSFRLMGSDGAGGNEHGRVDINSLVE